jgi:alkanesulfonate monooxygenase SsuD/methylene tetrahydromethanopterin reductase-like flavin-dependent oxidoreductase (luciferase family)
MAAPEVFMGAASQRTNRIRLVTALMHIGRYHNHPTEVAEQVSALDLLTSGRWEFGSGPAGPRDGTGMYGVPGELEQATQSSSAIWEEGLREVIRMMREEPYSGLTGGLFDEIPPFTLVPRPYQQPHPPLWRSAVMPGSYARCSRLGIGALMLAAFGSEMVRTGVEEYWQGFREGGDPVGAAINPSTAAFVHMHCAPTDEEAHARGREGVDMFSYGITNSIGQDRTKRNNLTDELQALRDGPGIESLMFNFAPHAAIGSPATIREHLRALEQTNVDVVMFTSTTGNIAHKHLLESMELVATEVLPEFRDRHDRHEQWRAEQLRDCPHPINATV